MSRSLSINACSFLMPEIAHVVKSGNYEDVHVASFLGNCIAKRNAKTKRDLEAQFVETDVLFISGICNNSSNFSSQNQNPNQNFQFVDFNQCFELFINREIVDYYISKGYYLVSNGWLNSLDAQINNWGFEPETAKDFFGKSMKGILFLDTLIPGDYEPKINELSEYMGLKYERLPVGLSHCKIYIENLINEWRNKKKNTELSNNMSDIRKRNADYLIIFEQLSSLVEHTDESKIVEIGFQLMNSLFAPSKITYTKLVDNTEKRIEFLGCFGTRHDDLTGFKIQALHSGQHLGFFELQGFQFPKYMDEYKKLSKHLSYILGLAIANARKHEVTIRQKEELEKLSADLQEINDSKDKLFSILAHDLKNPFSALLSFTELLISDIESGDNTYIEEYTRHMNSVLENTQVLLNNLLEWSCSQRGLTEFNPGEILLNKSVKEIVGALSLQAKTKNIDLKNIIPEDTFVYADRHMLDFIIRNLVSNAIKFTHNNGEIKIKVSTTDDNHQISVSDNGIGMHDETKSKLFKVISQQSLMGTNNEKGTGLGLMLCKEFIDKHNGKIWVESQIGHGSTFYFSLPFKKQ